MGCLSALLAAVCAISTTTRFDVGDYAVVLMPSRSIVVPTVTFEGRTFSLAYRTDGWLLDGMEKVDYHSEQTNRLAVLKGTAKGVRADYVHSLYAGSGGDRRLVGVCSNEVVFADGVVGVRTTLIPAEPGRYRFYAPYRAHQSVAFAQYEKEWVGTTLYMAESKEHSFMNELTPHDGFDPKAWGMNVNDIGYMREMELGNVPGVVRFKGDGCTKFSVNRYKGGFSAAAVLVNEDVMHKPAWDKPVSFSYAVSMEK